MKEFNDKMMELAENGTDEKALGRMRDRLVQDRKPQTAASTGTWVDWDREASILGQPWDSTKIPLSKLALMRRDPILAFGLMFVKVPLIRAPWYIKCSDPRIASAVDASLRKIYGRFILAYTNAFDFGFSPIVKRFKYDEKPDWTFIPKDNALAEEELVWTDNVVKPIVWKPFTALNPQRCVPHWNSKGEFNGIDFRQSGLGSPFFTSGYPVTNGGQINQKRLPDVALEWALWATNEKDSEFGSLWGYPRIGHAYRFWWSYWHKFGVADRAFEKWGDPPVIVYHPNDTTAVDANGDPINYTSEALALAESLRSGANVAMPSSVVSSGDEKPTSVREWQAEQMEVKTDFDGINTSFEYLDVQKLRAVMVPEQALVEGKGGTSSRNVASTFGDLFQESQAVVKQEIDDHLNRWVIPQFVDLNFGPTAARAEIVTTGFDPVDVETMREVVRLIGQRKLLSIVDDRKLLERLGMPTVSRKEMNERLARVAIETEEGDPPEVEAVQGADESAGVNDRGKYYAPRERIVLDSGKPFYIERVDQMPLGQHGKKACYLRDEKTLIVHNDTTDDELQGYLLQLLSQEATDDGRKSPSDGQVKKIFDEFNKFKQQLKEEREEDRRVVIELAERARKKRSKIVRDDQNFITEIREVEEEEDNE